MYDGSLMEFLKLETKLAYFLAQGREAIPLVIHTYSVPKYGIYMTTGSLKIWEEPTSERMEEIGRQLFRQDQGLITAAFLTGHSVAETETGIKEYITITGMTIDQRKVMAFFEAEREEGKLVINKTVNFTYKPATLEKMGSVIPLESLFAGYLDEYRNQK